MRICNPIFFGRRCIAFHTCLSSCRPCGAGPAGVLSRYCPKLRYACIGLMKWRPFRTRADCQLNNCQLPTEHSFALSVTFCCFISLINSLFCDFVCQGQLYGTKLCSIFLGLCLFPVNLPIENRKSFYRRINGFPSLFGRFGSRSRP